MLTNQDIDTIMEALDALQSKFSQSAFTDVLLGAMLSPKEDKATWKEEANKTMEEASRKGKEIGETIILLKAKLIGMRDRAIVEEASAFLKNGKE
jgi:hypothetical protein